MAMTLALLLQHPSRCPDWIHDLASETYVQPLTFDLIFAEDMPPELVTTRG